MTLDRTLVCKDTDTLSFVVTKMRHSRAHGLVVTDAEGKPLRVLLDSDVVLPFTKQPAWAVLFGARLWNEWLMRSDPSAGNSTPPPIDAESAGRRRSVSWSMPLRSRTNSTSAGSTHDGSPKRDGATLSPTPAAAIAAHTHGVAALNLSASPPKHAESPLRALFGGGRARSNLAAGE